MKNYQEITNEVKAFISHTLDIPIETITSESELVELSTDSIRLFELLLAFEKEYDMETSYDDVIHMHTVDDIVQYLQKMKYTN